MERSLLTRFVRATARKLNIEASDALLMGTIGSLIIMALGTLFTFINTVLLSRILGPAALGIYSFSQSLILFLAAPLTLGFSQLLTRRIAAYSASEDLTAIHAILHWSRRTGFWIVVPMVGVLSAVFLVGQNWLGLEKLYTLLMALALLPLGLMIHINGAALRALGHMVKGQLNDNFTRPFLFALFLSMFFLFPELGAISPAEAMALHILATFIALIAVTWMKKRVFPSRSRVMSDATLSDYDHWRRSFMTFAIFSGIGAVQMFMDVIILGILTDDSTVGVYRVAAQGMMLITAAALAIQAALSPSISKLHALGDVDGIQGVLRTGARVTLLVTLPAVALIVVFAEPVLVTVFGPHYSSGKYALSILMLGSLSYGVIGLGGPTLNMTGNENAALKTAAIGALFNLILNFLLIPVIGMEGAAVATVSSLIITHGLWAWQVKKRLNVSSLIIHRTIN